jgi:hypothetical protein
MTTPSWFAPYTFSVNQIFRARNPRERCQPERRRAALRSSSGGAHPRRRCAGQRIQGPRARTPVSHAAVRGCAGIPGEPMACRRYALAPHLGAQRSRGRHQQHDEGRHGGACDEEAARAVRDPRSSRIRATTCGSISNGDVIAATQVGDGGRKQLGQDADRLASSCTQPMKPDARCPWCPGTRALSVNWPTPSFRRRRPKRENPGHLSTTRALGLRGPPEGGFQRRSPSGRQRPPWGAACGIAPAYPGSRRSRNEESRHV